MSVRKFQVGDKAIVNNKCNHKGILIVGEEVIISQHHYSSQYAVKRSDGKSINYVNASGLDVIKPITTEEEFQKQIDKANVEIEKQKSIIVELKHKMEFLKETGSDQFNENEFKAFQTLTLIENTEMSKLDKAKAIAALIAQK